MTKMQWISCKHVVLWDEEEKRGWLVNGASALLHLLRASLEHSKRKLQSAFCLDPKDLVDAMDPTQPESAMEVLTSQRNRELRLYKDKSDVYDEETVHGGEGARSAANVVTTRVIRYYRVEDRVEHLYNTMEKLIDHQTDVERKSGLQINPRPRRQLEGWEFKDLVADGDPFFPRVSTLHAMGKGWVDFIRAIHAVTLVGRGFGELIQPKPQQQTRSTTACPRWRQLPTGRYYLAACLSDIKDIVDNDGDVTSNPMRLCENVLWHMKQAAFQPCPCTRDDISSKHHDPVQALFPSKFSSMLRKKPQMRLQDRGAVIFGHNVNLHWHWKDSGDPVKGDPPQELEDNVAVGSLSSYDSGLGSSLQSSLESSLASSSTGSPTDHALSSTRSSATETPPSRQDTPATTCSPEEGMIIRSKRRLKDRASLVAKRMRLSRFGAENVAPIAEPKLAPLPKEPSENQ